jgi:transcriptional regulator with XRE-family HTH domain
VAKSIYTAEQEKLQLLLREVRDEAGLTQALLARRLDRPQSFVSKYESGERRLDLVELRQICQALGITLAKLVERFEVAANSITRQGKK